MEPKSVRDICAIAKKLRKKFDNTEAAEAASESHRMDSTVCLYVLGPITPASRSEYFYVVTFMMKKSQYVTVFPLRKKSDATKAFKK
uniref:Uncharacterized protein n=1 Tax=Peronospora matthiolae TaxID=2874970 RepID=A0AAV1UPK0_9STRA